MNTDYYSILYTLSNSMAGVRDMLDPITCGQIERGHSLAGCPNGVLEPGLRKTRLADARKICELAKAKINAAINRAESEREAVDKEKNQNRDLMLQGCDLLMQGQLLPRVRPENSNARREALILAAGIVCAYPNLPDTMTAFKRIWPECDFYKGITHYRVLIKGKSDGPSIFVETSS